MKKGSKIFIIILVVIFLLFVAIALVYYFYPQKIEELIKPLKKEEIAEEVQEEKYDKSEKAERQVVLNGKEHTLNFEYVYSQQKAKGTLFNTVKAKVFFDDIFIGENYVYTDFYDLDEFDNPITEVITEEDTKNHMKNEFVLEDEVNYKIIKGKNAEKNIEEYLFFKLKGIGYDMLLSTSEEFLYKPLILNDKGEVFFEIEGSERPFNIPKFPFMKEDQEKYDDGKIHFEEDEGITKIEHLLTEYTGSEEGWHNHRFYIRTLSIIDGKIKEEKRLLVENEELNKEL